MKKFQYKKKNLRPTSSKVIGAVFSILGHENLQGKNFLDLYAGTGALGLRALELGVSNCYFVDINNKFLQKIKNQVEKYDFEGEARMIKANCENQLGKISEKFDFIFADPPYSDNSIDKIVSQIIDNKLSGQDTKLIFEHSSRQNIAKSIKIFNMQGQKEYGDTSISIFSSNKEG